MLHHDFNQLRQRSLTWIPSQYRLSLCRVTQQLVNFTWTEELRIYLNQYLTGFLVDTFFFNTLTLPFQFDATLFECHFSKFPYCMIFTRSDNEVIRFRLLQNQPHALHIILSISPVTQ